MPTGRPVSGETTTRWAVSCSSISCTACSSDSSGETVTISVPAISVGGRLLGARAQRAHQVEVGDDAPGEPVAGMVAPDDAGDHDAVDRLLGHRAGDGRDVVVRLAVEEPELHGIADPGAAEDFGG